MSPSCALFGGFAIGARITLLWQHYGNGWQSPAVIRQAHRTLHACRTRTLRMPAKTPLAGDNINAPAACAVPFRPYCGGIIVTRTRNVSEYMLVLALCLVRKHRRLRQHIRIFASLDTWLWCTRARCRNRRGTNVQRPDVQEVLILRHHCKWLTVLNPVYSIQPVVKRVWQPSRQPVWQPVVSRKRGFSDKTLRTSTKLLYVQPG